MPHVFIHGLGQTPASWDETLSHLSLKQAACPNLTSLLQNCEATYANLYQAFSMYCDQLDDPLILCGLSLGGVLALHYAIDHPERVHSLALIGTQYKMPKALLRFQNLLFRFMPDSMFEQMGFGKAQFLLLCRTMMELDFSASLSRISCPALVVCGEKDGANRKASEALARLLPGAQLCIIEDAGHEINVEHPEALADALITFFAKHELCKGESL